MLSRIVKRIGTVPKSPDKLVLLQSRTRELLELSTVTGIVSCVEGYVEKSFVDIDKLQGSLKITNAENDKHS